MTPPATVIWFMGPTSAGKSTLAAALRARLANAGRTAVHWDGDDVRAFFGANHGFAPESRLQVVNTLIFLASRTSAAGAISIVSALTAHPDARQRLAEELPGAFVVHVSCPLDELIGRDPKGLYAKAIGGEIDTLIGYNSDYVPPAHPDLQLDTSSFGIARCVDDVWSALERRRIL